MVIGEIEGQACALTLGSGPDDLVGATVFGCVSALGGAGPRFDYFFFFWLIIPVFHLKLHGKNSLIAKWLCIRRIAWPKSGSRPARTAPSEARHLTSPRWQDAGTVRISHTVGSRLLVGSPRSDAGDRDRLT